MEYLLVGILGGIIGGMGMGGGTLLIPLLTIFMGVEQRTAQLINTISFVPMAIVTIIVNARMGLLKWRYILYVGVSSCIAAIGGSYLSSHIDSHILALVFGSFLVLVGLVSIVMTIVGELKARRNETPTSINVKKPKNS